MNATPLPPVALRPMPGLRVPAALPARLYKVIRLDDPTFAAIQQAPAGTQILISGVGFGTSGTLTVGPLAVPPLTWHDSVIVATLPPVTADATGILTVTPTAAPPVALPAAFTITAAAPPPPPPPVGPQITGYQDAQGQPLLVAHPQERLVIVGSGFGATKGVLLWMGKALVPLVWTDTRIEAVLDVGPPPAGWMTINTAGGQTYSAVAFPLVP